jgi:hypothetical protein
MSDRSLSVSPPSRSILLAGVLVLLAAMPVVAAPVCRPALSVRDVRFSEIHLSQRLWVAQVDVDASGCAARSGRFDIEFIRLKEAGPDVRFSETFTWTPGRSDVSTTFWEDEAVLDYAIGFVAPCACRQ